MCQRNDFRNTPPLEGSPSQSLPWCPQGAQRCVCARLHLIGEPLRCVPSEPQTTMVCCGGLKKYQHTGSGGYSCDRRVSVARSPGAGLPKIVYRGGARTPDNLTSRPGIDRQGLSTFETLELTVQPGGKAQVIDLSRLQAPLVGVPDAPPPGHVSIRLGLAFTPEVLHSTTEWASSPWDWCPPSLYTGTYGGHHW